MQFRIPGKPVPYQRTRGSGKQRYSEPRYAAWREKASWALKLKRGRSAPIKGAVSVTLLIYEDGIEGVIHPMMTGPSMARPKGVRGDLDNYVKAVLDSANGIAFDDDRQCAEVYACFVPGAMPTKDTDPEAEPSSSHPQHR